MTFSPISDAQRRLILAYCADESKQLQVVRLNGVWDFDGPFTIPRHVKLIIPNGAALRGPHGTTITIESQVVAGRYPIFLGEAVIALETKQCKAEWHGAVPDATYDRELVCTNPGEATPSYHAFRKSKLSVGDNGKISYGPGAFFQADESTAFLTANGNWQRTNFCIRAHEPRNGQDNLYTQFLEIELDRNTVLLAESPNDQSIFGAVDVATYRDGGWAKGIENLHPYIDNIDKGGTTATLKVDTTDLNAGDMIYLSGGASGFDQFSPGQFLRIREKVGRVLMFERAVEHNMALNRSSANGYVLEPFDMPAEGGQVQVRMSVLRNAEKEPPGAKDSGSVFSIGNDLFRVRGGGFPSDVFTIESIANKGNLAEGTTVPVGTPVLRRRVINRVPSCIAGMKITGGTIAGVRGGTRVSNTYEALFEDVHFVWRPLRDTNGVIIHDGLYFDSDASYGHIQRRCIHTCFGMIGSSQWARASVNGIQEDCIFVQARWDATEGCLNIRTTDCKWHMDFERYPNPDNKDEYGFICGQTTSEVTHVRPQIYQTGGSSVIDGSGVQEFTNTMGGGHRFVDALIYPTRVTTLFSGPRTGFVEITNPHIYGEVRYLLGRTGTAPLNGITGDKQGRYTLGNGMRITGLKYVGKIDALSSAPLETVHCQGEIIWEGYSLPGGDATARNRGTLLRNDPVREPDENGVDRDVYYPYSPLDIDLNLRLTNWPYADGGMFHPMYEWNDRSKAIFDFRTTKKTSNGTPENFYQVFGNAQLPYVRPEGPFPQT